MGDPPNKEVPAGEDPKNEELPTAALKTEETAEKALDSKRVGKWLVAQSVSPVDGSLIYLATLPSKEEVDGQRPRLALLWKDRKFRVFLSTKFFLGSHDLFVAHRFDDVGEVQAVWNTSSDGGSAFAPEPAAFTKAMLTAIQLSIYFVPYADSPKRVTFDLADTNSIVRDAIELLRVEREQSRAAQVPGVPVPRLSASPVRLPVPESDTEAKEKFLTGRQSQARR